MINNTHIWEIDLTKPESNSGIQLEIFSGRDKYTKAGLFSGPLRRQEIDPHSEDDAIRFLFSTTGATQTGKNTFCLSNMAVSKLFQYFEQCQMSGVYCRLQDKKRHRVKMFVADKGGQKGVAPLIYDSKSGTLIYSLLENATPAVLPVLEKGYPAIEPVPHLYLNMEEKLIRGFLTFVYDNIEIQANTKLEKINLSSGILLRDFRYERETLQRIYEAGGHTSIKNEITFYKKIFFSKTLPLLLKTEIALFWGANKEKISRAAISCSISYDMDWFSVSGVVTDGTDTYNLSELLRASRGKVYAQLKDGILFLPEPLHKIARCTTKDEKNLIPHKELWTVHQLAESQALDPGNYLSGLSKFSETVSKLSPKWEMILRHYQKEGVMWALNLYQNHFGGCLADDMGLGKTVQAIAVLCSREKHTKLPDLIVSPKIVLYNWLNELERFAPNLNLVLAYGDFDYQKIKAENVIYLTTYDTLFRHNEAFIGIGYDTIIMDETQMVKNYRTKRYHALKKLQAGFMLALSGTPIENNIEELWSLFNLLNPGMLGSHSSFMKTFGTVNTSEHSMERLKKIISPFLLRRTKDTVLNDLPSKEESRVYCEMTENQRALYDTLLVSVRKEIERKPSRNEIKDNSAAILQALLYLRESCSDPALLPPKLRSAIPCDSCKMELFQEYVNRIVPASDKVIVYSLFPRVLKKMETWCQQQGWKTFYIDGQTNNRQKIVEDFEKSVQGVFFISLKAGGLGLNLTSCQYVLIYDPWWNATAEQQAADRVYRIGQEKPVFIYHFLVKNTIEEKIYELQQKKIRLSSGILDELNQSGTLSMEEILELLS